MLYYDVARIVNTHGLKGAVKVSPITDFPHNRFAAGAKLVLKDDPGRQLTVKAGRPFKQRFWLLQFAEINDIAAAQQLKGKVLAVSAAAQQKLPAGAYYYHQIIGCTVVDQQTGAKIGQVTDIEAPGANDIWLVKEKSGKEFWLPYISDVVKRVDVRHKRIEVVLMEGLRDED